VLKAAEPQPGWEASPAGVSTPHNVSYFTATPSHQSRTNLGNKEFPHSSPLLEHILFRHDRASKNKDFLTISQNHRITE